MKTIKIKSLCIENFKGIKTLSVGFGNKTRIKGQNASGKSTIFDAVCWVLFDKNSAGESKFEIRPLDENGKRIDHLDIKVVAVLEVDGNEVELSKTQKQKWTKRRGTALAELQGNENLFEVDGYPKSESEYKAYIANVVNEDLFKMITNPQYFANMKWKDQRGILMKFAETATDAELAAQIDADAYVLLIPELKKASSTEDIQKKYSRALSEWKKKQQEIPVRIDELSKSLIDIDVAELELAKYELERRLEEAKLSSDTDLSDLMSEEMRLQFDLSGIMQTMNRELSEERIKVSNALIDAKITLANTENELSRAKNLYEENEKAIKATSKKRSALGDEYRSWKAKEFVPDDFVTFRDEEWIFDENSTFCSMCGQKLPDERISEIRELFEARKETAKNESALNVEKARKAFDENKKSNMDRIVLEGYDLKAAEEAMVNNNKEIAVSIETFAKGKGNAEAIVSEWQKKLDAIPKEADYETNEEFVKLSAKRKRVLTRIEEIKTLKETQEIDITGGLKVELEKVNADIARASRNAELKDRIEELKEEQRDVTQKIADQEQMIYLLESFIRAKMERISSDINRHFKTVNFKLFKMLLNGGVEECCECTVNGVPYSALNSGHRIIAGMDIISSLSELYGIETFIFTDNAESLNEYNIPEMDAQMILLSVSDDKKLVVEVD